MAGHDKHEHEDPKDQRNHDHKDDRGNQKDGDNKTEHEVQKDGDHKDEHGVQKDGDHKDEHNDQNDSDHKDKPVELKHKSHLQSFDEETESMVKKVKQAMANGEGCRVFVRFLNFCYVEIFTCGDVTNDQCLFTGVWCFRCAKGCWELSYLGPWTEHFCCSDGKDFEL